MNVIKISITDAEFNVDLLKLTGSKWQCAFCAYNVDFYRPDHI